jgi:hypothetical protein
LARPAGAAQENSSWVLFDHLVGEPKQYGGKPNTERSGGRSPRRASEEIMAYLRLCETGRRRGNKQVGKPFMFPQQHLIPLICPTGKSPACLSSPLCKNISVFTNPTQGIYPSPSCPTEGRIRIVRDAGRDAVDAAASGAQVNGRAGFGLSQTRERSNGVQTNGVVAYGEVVWFRHPLLVSSWRRRVGPTGRGYAVNSPMTVTRRIRRRGERV